MPLVTVVVPVRDSSTYLDCCLASLRGQSHQDLEVVIVDDASTDSSLAIATRHASEDSRLRIISLASPLGVSNARNVGIDEAQGEFLMFADSDDTMAPDVVSRCVAAAREHEVDLVLFGYCTFDESEGETQWAKSDKRIPVDFSPAGSTAFLLEPQFAWLKCVRTEVVKANGIRFPVDIAYGEDRVFHWALWMLNVRSVRIGAPLYGYRQRAASITRRHDDVLLDQIAVQELILGRLLDRGFEEEALTILCEQSAHTAWFVYLNIERDLVSLTLERIALLASKFPPDVRHAVSPRSRSGFLWQQAQSGNAITRWLLVQARVGDGLRRRVLSVRGLLTQ